MKPLTQACSAVTRAIATNQIGTPVAARILAHGVVDLEQLRPWLAYAIETSAAWLNSSPRRLWAMESAQAGHISALVAFGGGQTALVSVGSTRARSLVEIAVWGQRGVWAWEGDCRLDAAPRAETPPSTAEARWYLHAIRESLSSGQTATIGPRAARVPDVRDPQPLRQPLVPSEVPDALAARRSQGRPLAPVKPPFGVLLVAGDQTHQPAYAETFRLDPRCRLIGVTDEASVPARRQQLNEQLATRLGIPFLPHLSAALARDDVHVVSICAEPMRRERVIVPAATAGKHLYLDKPLAGSLADADAIVAAVNQAGVIGHMMSLVRSDVAGCLQTAFASGAFGEFQALHADLCFAKGRTGTADLAQPRQESEFPCEYELPDSKRELNNIGVYPLVALLWLTGRRVRRVAATTGNYFFQEHQRNNMEDFGQALLELDDGAVAGISAGRTGWQSHPLGGLNRTTLIGTLDAATFDPYRSRAVVFADAEPWRPPERDAEDPMGMWSGPKQPEYVAQPKQTWIAPAADAAARDVAYFLDCVETGRPSDVPVDLAAAVTEILLACYQSASRGEIVSLPLVRV